MKDYKKYFIINATPDEIYTALTNPFTIELWSGEEAIMSIEPGSEFSLFDGSIEGRNLEFETNKKIACRNGISETRRKHHLLSLLNCTPTLKEPLLS